MKGIKKVRVTTQVANPRPDVDLESRSIPGHLNYCDDKYLERKMIYADKFQKWIIGKMASIEAMIGKHIMKIAFSKRMLKGCSRHS